VLIPANRLVSIPAKPMMSISGESGFVSFGLLLVLIPANRLVSIPAKPMMSITGESDDVDYRQIGCCRF
jgi:hypothetical protein